MHSNFRKDGQGVSAMGYLVWWGAGLLMLALALLSTPTAWADTVICSGQSSIPISPTLLKIVRGTEVTYGVSLCSTPTASVTVTALLSPTGNVTVTPGVLVFDTPLTQTMGVSLAAGIDTSQVFTVEIRHSTASTDPDYNWGTTNVPSVIVVYRPPLAVNDGAGTTQGQAVGIAVLANDVDRSGTGLTVTSITQPANGTAAINLNQTVTFTPTGNFTGTTTFGYSIRDGDGNTGAAQVMVTVAPSGSADPIVEPIDPQKQNTGNFTQTVTTPNGTVPVTTTVVVPANAFTFTVGPTDTLAIVFTPVVTPTGPVNTPPNGVGGQAGAAVPAMQYSGLTFNLSAWLNSQSLSGLSLAKPMTLTISYGPQLVTGKDPNTLTPYYWNGSAWSNSGVVVVARDTAHGRINFTVNRIIGELSFFIRPPALYMPLMLKD